MNRSIYNQINSAVNAQSGKLPSDFTLEKDKREPNQLTYAPGAMDGIGIFHMSKGNPKTTAKKVVALLMKYFKTKDHKYITKIEELLTDDRTLSIVDDVLEQIKSNRGKINADSIVESALELAKNSDNAEIVKIGLALLGLFELSDYLEATAIVSILGVYDDFTLFAIVAALNWENGNNYVFEIAQNVDGWGKIHAVERLEVENEEIRQWILRKGCENGILNAYLGLVTAEKGDLISALRQDTLDSELFNGVSVIVTAMLDEGPVHGISVYEHAREALELYLKHSEKHAETIKHLSHVLEIRSWVEYSDDEKVKVDYKAAVLTGCEKVTDNPKWREKIQQSLKNRDDDFNLAVDAARQLCLDMTVEILSAVKADPPKYGWQLSQLMQKSELAEELIALCESALPLDEMASGMGDYMFPDVLRDEYNCLDFVLQQLGKYPLQGCELVKCALNSPVTRNRNMAARALAEWVEKLKKTLFEISSELHDEVARISKIEVNDTTKEHMQKLCNKVD